jgi:beta-mannosidase
LTRLILIASLFLLSCQEQKNINIQQLSDWKILHNNTEINVSIPSNNISDLLKNNLILDPFVDTNEDSIQWIAQQNWEYQTTFDVLPSLFQHTKKQLIFHGLDTYADVYLNDSLVLQVDNMFRTWTVSVEDILLKKANLLKVKFHPVDEIEQQKIQQLGYDLPGGSRVHTRKAGFHYGWDWGAKITPSGIWKEVALEAWSLAKLKDIYYKQTFLSDSLAIVEAQVQIDVVKSGEYEVSINDSKYSFFLNEGNQTISIPLHIKNPQWWWPIGYGEQYRYAFRCSLMKERQILDENTTKFGLREVEFITDKQGEGSEFYFKINGKPIFMKGANYIPQDHLQSRVKTSHYQDLLDDVCAANMNMLRVWGGGIYENDIFYDLCDSLGLLVWQDFMFACAMYPSDSSFLHSVEQEAIDNVSRLRNHPSIVLWCGNNENSEGWQRWGWQDAFDDFQKEEIEKGYKALFNDILPTVVNEYSTLPYWESSPKLGRGDPQHHSEGDAHYWGVWHDAEPFEMLEEKVPRFMSEFGFQSFPSLSTIAEFADSTQWALDSEVMRSHQKHPRGNALILEYMQREYNVPSSFEKLIYTSQVLQAEGMRIGLEAHRRSQPYCMGTLYWQLNDCWPVASWSSIDYYGNWKALHYATKEVFAPLALSLSMDKNNVLQVYAMSELAKDIEDTLEILVYDLEGRQLSSKRQAVKIKANTSTYLSSYVDYSKDQLIMARLINRHITSKELLSSLPKDCKFIQPNVEALWRGDTLILTTDVTAHQLYLHNVKGQFSDNFFTLLPQTEKRIIFSGPESEKNKLLIWSLYDLQDNEK